MIKTIYNVFAHGEDSNPMYQLGERGDAEGTIYYRRGPGHHWAASGYTVSDFASMDEAANVIGAECGEDVDAIDDVASGADMDTMYGR